MEKIEFYTGHSGGTSLRVVLVFLIPILTHTIAGCTDHNPTSALHTAVLEILTVYTCVLSLTALADYLEVVSILLAFFVVCLALRLFAPDVTKQFPQIQCRADLPSCQKPPSLTSPRRSPVLTTIRGSAMLIALISIFAVDFQVFPREFAKTETFGISVMDTGLGGFVACQGIMMGAITRSNRAKAGWRKRVLHAIPSLVLGGMRLAFVAMSGYHEVVTEYGAHWNFFLSLAAIQLVCLPCRTLPWLRWSRLDLSGLIFLVPLCGFQLALSAGGLTEWMFHAPRVSPLASNREGIVGLFGLVCLFYCSHPVGQAISLIERGDMPLRVMGLGAIGTHAVALGVHTFVQPISRRLVNLSYVLWILALVGYISLVSLLVHKIFRASMARRTATLTAVVPAVSNHMLFVFLIANVATGIGNMALNTIHMDTPPAMAALVGYSSVVTAAAVWANILLNRG